MKSVALIGLSAALVVSAAAYLNAGDIDPPGGPIAPTMKTLTDVEPRIALSQETTPGDGQYTFVIDSPGSYYLTGNMSVSGIGRGAIRINEPQVTLDLNGFKIEGIGDTGSAIVVATGRSWVRISNGVVEDFRQAAIQIPGGAGHIVEGVRMFRNDGGGIDASSATVTVRDCNFSQGDFGMRVGEQSVVQNCQVEVVSFEGISTGPHSLVEGCHVAGGSAGIAVHTGSVVRNSTARSSATGILGNGFGVVVESSAAEDCTNGISLTNGSTVLGSTARGNSAIGIRVGTGSVVTSSTAFENGGNGVETQTSGVVRGVSSYNNGGSGIVCGDGSSISDSVVFGSDAGDAAGVVIGRGSSVSNTVSRENAGDGFYVDIGSSVNNCTARGNGGYGFTILSGSTVVDSTARTSGQSGFYAAGVGVTIDRCTAHANTEHGIFAGSGSVIRNCTARANGLNGDGDGINVFGSDTLIEGNNCNGNDRGIVVQVPGSIIQRNRVSGSSDVNWSVVFGNVCFVIDAESSSNSPVLGDSGGTAYVTSDPNVNYTY